MTVSALPDWDGDVAAARALQIELAKRVQLRDDFAKPLRTIAGFDVELEDDGAVARATAVLLDADTLEVLESQVARAKTRMPPISGLRSFRELPALLEVLSRLSTRPDLAFVDGQGIAHPRRLGIASHLGIAADLPTIGVAKKILVGTPSIVLHDMRGAFTTLRDEGEQIGWLLRSKPGCLPLIVSPGHRVAMATAPEMTMRFVTTYRLPEPTRLAAGRASGGDE